MSTELQVVESNPLMVLKSWEELTTRAEYLAKSQLIPAALRGKPADVAIILQMGVELGIPPMQAINGVDVIQGKPTVSPQLAIALIRSKVPKSFIKIEVDEVKLTASVTMARDRDRLDESYTSTWTMAKAQKMGLTAKDNYQKQPANMLKWRAVMDCSRAIFADVVKGLEYSPDEVEDFASPTSGEAKAASISAALRPVEKEVIAEVQVVPVIAPQPIVAPVIKPVEAVVLPNEQEQTEFNPLEHYEIPIGDLKGKTLGQVGVVALNDYLAKVAAHYKIKNALPVGKWLELTTRAEQFIASETAKEDAGPSFQEFVK